MTVIKRGHIEMPRSGQQPHVLIMTDYRGAFWSSTRNASSLCSMDIGRLALNLRAQGCTVEVVAAADVDFVEHARLSGFLLYTSSEDEGGRYKRFLESRVLGLELAGLTPMPAFPHLLAHHDKAYMEAIRSVLLAEEPGQPDSRSFGVLEEFDPRALELPMVLKPASGAGSRGVTLVRSERDALKAASRLSRSPRRISDVRELAKRRLKPDYPPRSLHRGPFVAQELVRGLAGDYKVLRYGRRMYILGRSNRPGDFRASGSGLLDYRIFDKLDVRPILDMAWEWSERLGSPFVSMDVGYSPEVNGGVPALIEFQCVSFGPASIENSKGHFRRQGADWQFVEGSSDYESVFAEAAVGAFRSKDS